MATLQGLLMLAVKTSEEETFPTMSFPITQPFRNMLYVGEKVAFLKKFLEYKMIFSLKKNR
jgi:hypothetical protein